MDGGLWMESHIHASSEPAEKGYLPALQEDFLLVCRNSTSESKRLIDTSSITRQLCLDNVF